MNGQSLAETCATCRFASDPVAVCMRYPPVPVWRGSNWYDARPAVAEDGWCGEWKSETAA